MSDKPAGQLMIAGPRRQPQTRETVLLDGLLAGPGARQKPTPRVGKRPSVLRVSAQRPEYAQEHGGGQRGAVRFAPLRGTQRQGGLAGIRQGSHQGTHACVGRDAGRLHIQRHGPGVLRLPGARQRRHQLRAEQPVERPAGLRREMLGHGEQRRRRRAPVQGRLQLRRRHRVSGCPHIPQHLRAAHAVAQAAEPRQQRRVVRLCRLCCLPVLLVQRPEALAQRRALLLRVGEQLLPRVFVLDPRCLRYLLAA
ncbi:hypothetical protein GGI05_005304, partial [Coemansia sp. RSA 2603]